MAASTTPLSVWRSWCYAACWPTWWAARWAHRLGASQGRGPAACQRTTVGQPANSTPGRRQPGRVPTGHHEPARAGTACPTPEWVGRRHGAALGCRARCPTVGRILGHAAMTRIRAESRIDTAALKRERPLEDVVAAYGIPLRRGGAG